jgi:hypothetical protein
MVKPPSIRSGAERDNEGAFFLEEKINLFYTRSLGGYFLLFQELPPGADDDLMHGNLFAG